MRTFWNNVNSANWDFMNPLTWPFLLSTLAYGVGFSFFYWTEVVQNSSLYQAIGSSYDGFQIGWGIMAIAVNLFGTLFLLFNKPHVGKFSGLAGSMLWIFAGLCWAQADNILGVAAVAIPNAWFWFWQYVHLMRLDRQRCAC